MVVNINSTYFIQKIEEMEERIAKLEEINTVQNKHIAYLQKRTRSFFDRFKFGRFKPLDITKEGEAVKPKRKGFVLNDD